MTDPELTADALRRFRVRGGHEFVLDELLVDDGETLPWADVIVREAAFLVEEGPAAYGPGLLPRQPPRRRTRPARPRAGPHPRSRRVSAAARLVLLLALAAGVLLMLAAACTTAADRPRLIVAGARP